MPNDFGAAATDEQLSRQVRLFPNQLAIGEGDRSSLSGRDLAGRQCKVPTKRRRCS